ncbi:delta-12 fatty acid desaturase protein [Boletus edulis]|uniref:Fatty acid conjugase n=1 Tax=Boletus edulis BED1 TaxID=1328754 RepID=A0AAD4BPF5_BOLED|nr:delta-12 fatty acid desaturase protein [Boletus edulis]KAF8435771.1 fatty acid conjugase [Boletus edulis BED1]
MPLDFLADGPEYLSRIGQPFTPPDVDINALRAAIPKQLFERSTSRALLYTLRVLLIPVSLYVFATNIDKLTSLVPGGPLIKSIVYWTLWCTYWWWQGLAWSGVWVLGHEAGHSNLSKNVYINHTIGFLCHSFIFLPYFSWRITHLRHHKVSGMMENDEVFVPYVRSEKKLPPKEVAHKHDYDEILSESPLYTLVRVLVMQIFGHHTYLTWNQMGSKRYPKGTNHWKPSSALFKDTDRNAVIVSNLGLIVMFSLLVVWTMATSITNVVALYVIPWCWVNHWVVAMAFLQHTCATIPHYRKGEWNWRRGALTTVDRPFLGFIDSLFLLGVNRYHTAHHLFSTVPFYNLPEVHATIRPLLGDAYSYDSTGVWRALWRSFVECVFVEDTGDILFYKGSAGTARREVAPVERH